MLNKVSKKFSKLVLANIILVMSLSAAAAAKYAKIKVEAIYNSYSYIQDLRKEIIEDEQALRSLVATAEAEIRAMREAKEKPEKIAAERKMVQQHIDDSVKDLEIKKQTFNQNINVKLNKVIEKFVQDNGIDVLLNANYVAVADAEDVTAKVIKLLEEEG